MYKKIDVISAGADPRIMLPTDIISQHYVGVLQGYYIDNTNYYNVLPYDAAINETKVGVIGYIYPYNIWDDFGENISKHIKWLNTAVDSQITKAERFRKSLSNREYIDTFTSNDKETISTELIKNGCSLENNPVLGFWEDDILHLVQVNFARNILQEVKIETYALKLDVFSRNTGILESSIMLDKSALFIGCGSVGSLVALELAKAGVGKFMLVDNDVFGYHNICRHQCGIYDVGRYKTDALADRILQINPYAVIVKKNCVIQDVDKDEIMSFCDHNSIVIGGADNREGDLYANGLAQEVGMPFMSIGCWERAFAGEIFYCLPTGMPTYEDFLAAVGYVSGRVTQNRRFYTTEEELEKVSFEPGISADVSFVTIIAVKMALDLLNRNNPEYTQRLLPHLTQYTLVCNTNNPDVGGPQAEIFSYPLQVTTSIIVPYRNKE